MGQPGEPPFTRGIHPQMFRSRPPQLRSYGGFETPKALNEYLKAQIAMGITAQSIAFDLPTQIGYDASDERAAGEIGNVGVSVSDVTDMVQIMDGIDITDPQIRMSMTINATGPLLALLYIAVARARGEKPALLNGTIRYFLLVEDHDDDMSSSIGLEDDARVVNFVAAELGRRDLLIEL